MNAVAVEKTMTIKEIAEVLKKDESTVRKIGKSLFPGSFNNGVKTLLNEKQVTMIKLNLGKNSELPQTSLEKKLIVAQAIQILNTEIEELRSELSAAQPKLDFYDAVTGSKDAIPMGQAAKVLCMGIGRNKLFSFLRDKHILMNNNEPYQTFIDKGWFRVIEQKFTKPDGDTQINIKTMVYQKGLDGIRKLYQKQYTRSL